MTPRKIARNCPKNRHGAGQTPNTDCKRFTAISQKWAENVCK